MKFKKLLATVLMVSLCFSLLSVTASAYTDKSKTVSGSSNFQSSWSKTYQYEDSVGVPIGVIQYGFNTWLTDEDELAARSLNNFNGQGGIQRGSSSIEWGVYVVSGYLSEVEIKHTSDTVKYILRLY